MVEGALGGGYEQGLENAIALMQALQAILPEIVELQVVGRVEARVRERIRSAAPVTILWTGVLPRERIPEVDRSADVLFSADINAACPNTVVEALACGLPVIGFDTGALPELVRGDAGILVPYGGDPWELDEPDVETLARAAVKVLREPGRFRTAARARAQDGLGLAQMTTGYLAAIDAAIGREREHA
jgi:glycosyltransferase involved in cell wall biosynthesis